MEPVVHQRAARAARGRTQLYYSTPGPAKQAVPGPITYHQPTEHSVEHPLHHPRHCSPNQSSHLPTSRCQGRREGTKINTMQPAALRSVAVDQSFQPNKINGKTWHVLFWGRGMSGQLLRLYAAAVISLPGSSGSGVVPVGARLFFACSAANKQVN